MTKKIISKSYGKVILAGEHAVVYGKPALILPIDRFCEVGITKIVGRHDGEMVDGKFIIKNQEKDNHNLVNFVVKKFLQEFQIKNPPDLQIEIKSNIPVGCGFGSSAAVTTALTKGFMEYFNVGVDHTQPIQLFLDFCISCENLIHKISSGADIYTTWFGKPLWFRKESGNLKLWKELEIEKKKLRNWSNEGIYLIDTGKPIESTGEMVQIAAKLKNSRPKFFNKQINLIERHTLSLLHNFTALQNSPTTPPSSNSLYPYESIHEDIMQTEKSLEKIGVVSEEVKRFIKDLRVRQIPAKICGAGGHAKGSGVGVVFANDKKALEEVCRGYNYSIIDVKILT